MKATSDQRSEKPGERSNFKNLEKRCVLLLMRFNAKSTGKKKFCRPVKMKIMLLIVRKRKGCETNCAELLKIALLGQSNDKS